MRSLFFLGVLLTGCNQNQAAGPAKPTLPPGDAGSSAAEAGSDHCAPTLASLTDDVFADACTASGCHGTKAPAAALDLSAGDLVARLIGQSSTCAGWPLVVAGDPNGSLLLRKLTAAVPDGCGDAMPPAAAMLSERHIACVRDWIASLDPDAAVAPGCDTCATDSCIDLTSDLEHCGECGHACPSGASCVASTCACSDGLAVCASGCTELATDPSNCGACGASCQAGELCTPTGCGSKADCAGLTVCGGACVDTATSLSHCGGCGMPCGSGQICDAGICTCPNGGTACGGSTCVDTRTDALNCGACGKVCPSGTTCQAGVCECPDRVVSFDADVAPVLANHCTNAGCHAGVKAKAALDLTLAKSYAEIVNVKASQCNDGRLLVKPNDAASSYLMQKIFGVDMCSGSQMPKAGVSLPAADLEALTAWICQGALH